MTTEAFTHVDDFVMNSKSDPYAAWMLMYFRLPAIQKTRFAPFMADRQLFCTYNGRQYRVIGGSRMGDIWLTSDFSKDHGYEHRVYVDQCANWSPTSMTVVYVRSQLRVRIERVDKAYATPFEIEVFNYMSDHEWHQILVKGTNEWLCRYGNDIFDKQSFSPDSEKRKIWTNLEEQYSKGVR